MILFKDDPEIEQWFRDLFADLVEACPELNRNQLNKSQVKARLSKYWHAFHNVKPEKVRKAFERAAISCKFFPSVPEIENIMSQGFGSQPASQIEEILPNDAKVIQGFKKLRESIKLKGMDVEEKETLRIVDHVCKNCNLWKRIDQSLGHCPHSSNEGKTTGPEWGENCVWFPGESVNEKNTVMENTGY